MLAIPIFLHILARCDVNFSSKQKKRDSLLFWLLKHQNKWTCRVYIVYFYLCLQRYSFYNLHYL